jgi:hypothetical protein
MTAIWRRLAGTCVNRRRPFNRNVRLAGSQRWRSPHCGVAQPGPNALAQLVRDRGAARLSHAEAQLDMHSNATVEPAYGPERRRYEPSAIGVPPSSTLSRSDRALKAPVPKETLRD